MQSFDCATVVVRANDKLAFQDIVLVVIVDKGNGLFFDLSDFRSLSFSYRTITLVSERVRLCSVALRYPR